MSCKYWARLSQVVVCLLGGQIAGSQSLSQDTGTLSPQAFISIVKTYHPVVMQANINIEKSRAEITIARGAFDPYASLYSSQKTFNGTNYYVYTNPELSIPTWYGIEVKAGIENNGGRYLTSEATSGKTSYLGLSVPLAKNLVIDNRRAALQQARLFRQQTESEKLVTVNDLLYNAYETYWKWVREYRVYQVLTNVVNVNLNRYQLVKTGFRQGDRPAIDTTEALAQIQNFQFQQAEALLRFKNAGIELSAFMWLQDSTWYQLDDNIVPDSSWQYIDVTAQPVQVLDDVLMWARINHPKLQSGAFKLESLEVERRLKFQSLLPTVNLKTNLLNRGYNFIKEVTPAFYENNNKFGIELALPLRLSEGRGGYRLAQLKIQETNFDLLLQRQEIENKIRAYFNELIGLRQQIVIYEQAYTNYQTLLRGETIRFNAGESTLFLLNTRENKVLETQQKLAELRAKFFTSQAALQWAAGQLR